MLLLFLDFELFSVAVRYLLLLFEGLCYWWSAWTGTVCYCATGTK